MTYQYLTLFEPTESVYKEKGSKFLAYAYPVEKEEDIKKNLEVLRKRYFDATHHCYAYVLGYAADKTRAQDDGEPNGTAGLPILNQIRSHKLTNTLVVVVRYFGGTKLGASGLVSAYKTATAEVLAQATIIEKFVTERLEIRFAYEKTNEVMKTLKELEAKILAQEFDNECFIRIELKLKWLEKLEQKLDFAQLIRQH